MVNDERPAEGSGTEPRRARLGAVASAGFSLLLVASLFVLFPFGVVIAPLGAIPVLHYQASGRPGYRAWGPAVLALAGAAAIGFPGIALDVLGGYLFVVVIPAVTIETWTRSRWTEGRWSAIAVGSGLVLSLSGVAIAAWPAAPQEATLEWMRAAVEEVQVQSQQLESLDEVQLDLLERVGSWVLPTMPVLYLVAIVFWIRPRLPLLGFELQVEAFEAYRSEEWLPAAFAVAGGATVLLDGTLRWVSLNLLLAVLALYFVHGLAIIRAHLARVFGRRWFVRWGVALLCLYPPMPPVVSMLGLTDSFWDLRRRADDDGGQ